MAATRRRSTSTWVITAVVLALAAGLIAAILGSGIGTGTDGQATAPPQGQAQPEGAESVDLTQLEARHADDLTAAGPVDAPVGLVVFSDYQCPFCGQWSQDTLPVMMEHAQAGDLRIEWRDVSVFGEESERAARAAYAAALQDKFWEYQNALFDGGQSRSGADLSEEALVEVAQDLGLDTEQFADDLNAQTTAEVVGANQEFATQIGVNSTPMFILGGQPISGAQPTEVFEEAFAQALADAE